MSEPLLTTRFAPPLLRSVERHRLWALLRGVIDAPFTLISAPAGFGKTTAIALTAIALREQGEIALAWLTLDPYDDDPIRFWRYVAGALESAAPGCGAPLAAALTGPQPPPITPLLTQTLNAIAAFAHPLLLVIDDYHLINQADIHTSLAFLLQHTPPNLHLALVTRADPPLPLHRLRAQNQLLEIRAADLRFDHAEAAALLTQKLDPPLSSAQIATLLERTEGWAAGLQLAGLALHGVSGAEPVAQRHDLIHRLADGNRFIVDYLTEEVLAQQPAVVRSFLLRTSMLQRFCGGLCDAVVGATGSDAMLELLARNNLFVVPLGMEAGGEAWYRYHQLFADLLRGQLLRTQPESITGLYRRAADWHAAHGDYAAAIEYALTGGDYARAVTLLENSARALTLDGHVLTVERWLGRLPPEWRQASWRAGIAFSWTLLLRGRYTEIAPYLARAEAAVAPDERLWRAEISALRAVLAEARGQIGDALEYARQALADVAEEQQLAQAVAQTAMAGALRASGDIAAAVAAYEQAIPLCIAARLTLPELLGRAHLGSLYLIQGRLRQAEAVLLPILTSQTSHPSAAPVLMLASEVLYERNRLDEALRHLRHALSLATDSGHLAAQAQGRVLMARLCLARDDIPGARVALDDAAVAVAQGVPAWIEPLLIVEQIRFHLRQGAPALAEQVLWQRAAVLQQAPDIVREALSMARARVLVAQGQSEDALALLDSAIEATDDRHGRQIEALALRAVVRHALGDALAARDDLRRALALAEPEGYLRTFVDAGPEMAALLWRAAGEYPRRLLLAFPPVVRERAEAHSALVEPLTDRERDVLRHMARGLTYQQIADTLVVSVNTVRYHIKSLYSKLQVDSRTLALKRAQSLNLLDDSDDYINM